MPICVAVAQSVKDVGANCFHASLLLAPGGGKLTDPGNEVGQIFENQGSFFSARLISETTMVILIFFSFLTQGTN